ncbi:fibronectin type III domain-containing protein [Glycomyces sp. NPDC046736]|uniref:fibronectin type III domain-containing protein n=1 Tax=Glycomyces sp. NPDC046736 TaxID=3155615 RepID=UPI003411E845
MNLRSSARPRSSGSRQLSLKGISIAAGLPIVLVGALVATLIGTGAFSRDTTGEDASLWLWTVPTGELSRVNGLTAVTDARLEIADAAGNLVQIVQNDRFLILRDITTGKVSAVDLRTLDLTGEAETAPGAGVRLALHEDRAFIVDLLQGQVAQVDPIDLSPVGSKLSFPPGLTGGSFDAGGALWLGVPREGTLVAVTTGDDGAAVDSTEVIADPGQDLSLTVLGDGVAVLNRTVQTVTTVRPDGKRLTADVDLAGPSLTAETSPGTQAAVTVTDPPSVVAVDDERSGHFSIAAESSPLLGASVEFSDRIYVPDGHANRVWVYSPAGEELAGIDIDAGGGPIELYATGAVLFANAPYTNQAVVVADDGTARLAPKDRDDILGGNVPPVDDYGDEDEGDGSGTGDESPHGEEGDVERPEDEPDPEPPGAVTDLTGVVADRAVTLSWGPAPDNGAPITSYVVEGDGRTWETAPGQRMLDIGDLVNGETYVFTVTARNAEGDGPATPSPPLRPTAEVPDPVAAVAALAHPDGTVTLDWEAPSGQGLEITGYQVELIDSGGTREVVAETAEPGHVFFDGELIYGRSYMFSVTALAGDAAAEPSPNSDTVVPFSNPGAPRTVKVTTDKDNKGTLKVSWNKPVDNGRTITGYVVTANGRSQTVTGTTATVSGLGNDKTVTVTVAAVNEAGQSPTASGSGTTIGLPKVTTWYRYQCQEDGEWLICRDWAYDDGGGNAECEVTWNGKSTGRIDCSLNEGAIGFIPEGDTNPMTVTIWNAAGKDSKSVKIVWA